jgi:peptide/nickel transport system permease protein
MGISLGYLVGGVVVVEVIFSLPGMAKLMVDAVSVRDFPMVQACAMVLCAIYILINLLADVVTLLCTPRLRHGR